METIIKKDFFSKIKEQDNIYSNFSNIMNKVLGDGYLEIFFTCITKIFKKEIKFAVTELSKLKKENKDINVNILIDSNLFIFKENFKIILTKSSNLKSRSILGFFEKSKLYRRSY